MTEEKATRNLYEHCQSPNHLERTQAYQQLGEFLLRVAMSRLQGKPELQRCAEDCVQETLITVWQKLDAGHGPDHPERFMSWCAAIVIHKLYDELRRQGYVPSSTTRAPSSWPRTKRVPIRQQQSLDQLSEAEEGRPYLEHLADSQAADPETDVVEQLSRLDIVLQVRNHPRLSDPSRKVLLQGYLAGLSDNELATLLKTPKSNVHVIRSRNLRKLREDSGFMTQLQAHFGTES